ncbi:MAG: catalase/peroxidase HPI [Planctomycetota bacterium]
MSAHTNSSGDTSGCPVVGSKNSTADIPVAYRKNRDWWPEQLDLSRLRRHSELSNPMDTGFDYAAAFSSLDLESVKSDINDLMTNSQEWWPADYGHYGPFFIRMAWHAAGTYRVTDGRGGGGSGMLRFAPLNSWPDNANLDKARRLLWPIKQKYGASLSWADLMILTGNCALESMGLDTFGFGGGREDRFEPDDGIYWGPESEWLGDNRYSGDRQLETPLGAVQMGLIYVNPEGPNGDPDPARSAIDIRETFARMAMNDEETVALIAGGHTFGKAHSAAAAPYYVGAEPEGAPVEQMGIGWKSSYGTGNGSDTITSDLEGAWTATPTTWDNSYFDTLFAYEWRLTKSPAGANQWEPVEQEAYGTVPDAHDESKSHAPMMLTTDIALRVDPAYEKISRRFHQNPDEFADAFARAWYKLTHRDMGPHERLLGPEVPEPQPWQDPVPSPDSPLIDDEQIATLKHAVLSSGLSISQLVSAAFAAAGSFRGTDKRGGANGGRLRFAPQRTWAVNDPDNLNAVLPVLEKIQADFNADPDSDSTVSFADLVVLAGNAAVEAAAKKVGHDVRVAFRPGRTDVAEGDIDVESFAVLELTADGFRNYIHDAHKRPAEHLLVDRADLLTLTAPEMTVLVGGMRVLNANTGKSPLGVLTDRPEALTNDFFVHLLDHETEWRVSPQCSHFYEGVRRGSDSVRWVASRVDLVFGSNSQLRALAEVYACDDSEAKFVADFVRVWSKLMDLDRFDQ